jgi:hypothetical protein
MSDLVSYDARVRAIRAYKQPLLDAFEAWLEREYGPNPPRHHQLFDIKIGAKRWYKCG